MANGSGTIDIKNGTFRGYMGTGSNRLLNKTGPNAFYGLKVIGGATVKIYGGNFDGGNGGAFVTGADVFNRSNERITIGSTTGRMANVLVYAGRFGSANTQFHDGFNVYDYANVVFGAYDLAQLQAAADRLGISYTELIDIYAVNATIALNNIANGQSKMVSTVNIHYGDYSKGTTNNNNSAFGIYFDGNLHSDTHVHIYNTRTNPQYTKVLTGTNMMESNKSRYTIYNNTTAVFYDESQAASADNTEDA
jgi:hypothetical protein